MLRALSAVAAGLVDSADKRPGLYMDGVKELVEIIKKSEAATKELSDAVDDILQLLHVADGQVAILEDDPTAGFDVLFDGGGLQESLPGCLFCPQLPFKHRTAQRHGFGRGGWSTSRHPIPLATRSW